MFSLMLLTYFFPRLDFIIMIIVFMIIIIMIIIFIIFMVIIFMITIIISSPRLDFTAEPILARKRRIKDLTSYVAARPMQTRRRGVIKEEEQEEQEEQEEEEEPEKENLENQGGKRRKEDVVPLLAEMTNEQVAKKTPILVFSNIFWLYLYHPA